MSQQSTPQPKRPRLLRWLLYIIGAVLLLVGFLLSVFYTLLFTESGSRWVLNKSEDWLPLSIAQKSGRIGDEMTALNLAYEQDGVVIKVDHLNYRIADIDWWQRRLEFDYIRLGHVSIQLPENDSTTDDEPLPPDTDIELPLSVLINELFVQRIQLNSEPGVYGPVLAQAVVNKGRIKVNNLHFFDAVIRMQATGEVGLNTRWPFTLDTKWSVLPQKIQGEGIVTGDITALTLNQHTRVNNDYVAGRAQINAAIELMPELLIDAHLTSEHLLVPVANTKLIHTAYKDLVLTVQGPLDNYLIELSADSEHSVKRNNRGHSNVVADSNIQHNRIQLNAHGDSARLQIDDLTIRGDMGQFKAHSTVNFTPHLKIVTDFNSETFNPQWLLPDWPGQISGSGHLKTQQTEQGDWQLILNQLQLDGQLKNYPLRLHAEASWTNQIIAAESILLTWGDNRIDINGQFSVAEQAARHQLNYAVELSQPVLLWPDLTGEVTARGQLSGTLEAPEYQLSLSAQNLNYQQQQIESLSVSGQGAWPQQLQLTLKAQAVETADQVFPEISLDLTGNLKQHSLRGDILHKDIRSQLTLSGGWFEPEQQWRGNIEKHRIALLDSDIEWQLGQAAELSIGQQIKLPSACWHSLQADGQACLALAVDTAVDLSVQAQLQLTNMQLALIKGFLPVDLALDGLLQGAANLDYQQSALSLNADLRAEQAALDYRKGQENAYHADITKAHLTASQDNGQTEIKTIIELDDNSYFRSHAKLTEADNGPWPQIEAVLEGDIKSSRFLVALSPELEQLQGEFTLSGDIVGILNRPEIELRLSQQSGFLILRQTGSRLTNIQVEVHSDKPGLMNLNASADSDEGNLQLSGQLDIQQRDNWFYQGAITGQNFRLLTLPEMTVNINPDLSLKASPQAIHIDGQLSLPMAEVTIKDLPPTATTSSADVVIHHADEQRQDKLASIPLHYDVEAKISEPIALQLMGLEAKMAGQLRVYDVRGQTHADGRLNLTEGFYRLYGQRLDIERGELIFNGPIDNPAIDVKAVRESNDGNVTAGILITGTVNQLNTTLFSEPAMSQLAVLSYLTTGRGLNESGGGTDGEQLAQAAILLGLKRSDSVFSQLQSTFGIDVLTIKQGANNEDSYIEAGQNISDDLYVGYSQGLFNRLGFWILRYKINNALRLETTQGENQTVDLIYVRRKK